MEERKTRNSLLSSMLLALGATFLYMMSAGIRNNAGIMLNAFVDHTGLPFTALSLVLAIGQLVFGFAQPIFGLIATKKGNKFALLLGTLLVCAGFLITPYCKTVFSLIISMGIIVYGGVGAISFGIVYGTISPRINEDQQPFITGLVSSSCGLGNTLITVVVSAAILAGGLIAGMRSMALLTALCIPVILLLGIGANDQSKIVSRSSKDKLPTKEIIKEATQNRDYLFIILGFFACGFHMAFLNNHFANLMMSCDFSYENAASVLSVFGVAGVVGSVLSGITSTKFAPKNVLGTIYSIRAVGSVLFIILPKTLTLMYVYMIFMGIAGAATITPVNELCRRLFGARGMSLFVSFAYVLHQIGSFFSSWLGGICFDRLGSYTAIYVFNIAISAAAALLSYKIAKIDYSNFE